MTSDVVIIGGGVMGSATAYHLLMRDPSLAVTVFEKDPTYRYASTVLSDGNIRVQFNLEENISMSLYGIEALETFADDMEVEGVRPEVSMREQGNLFLVPEEGRSAAEAGMALQRGLGGDVAWLSAGEIAQAYPAYTSDKFVGGTLGRRDGSVDPSAVLQGYRRKAISLGAVYLVGEVASIEHARGRARGVVLTSGETHDTNVVVNASGAWAKDLLATAGIDLPIEPVMRNVFVVASALESTTLPSVFLPSGVYLIPEHDGTWLIGQSQPDDPIGFDFSVHQDRFYERIWPSLIEDLPAFDRMHVTRGWAGLYAVNTLDGNAILGEWPEMEGLYLANGFSGHGFQHGHAVGRYLAELILGRVPELDLSRLGPQRIIDRAPVYEDVGRII